VSRKESGRILRRGWFNGAAAAVGGGATPQTVNDVNVLNFALRLANLESAFYQAGLAMFSPSDFQKSAAAQTIGGSRIGADMCSHISGFQRDEQLHVASLIQTVYSFDGPPQAPDCYNFGITDPDHFLQLAQTIENISVAAYNGTIIPQWQTSNATVNNPAVQALLATIATVEARHAAYFTLLNMAIPFPNAFDAAQTTDQTLAAIAPFLVANCSGPAVPLTLAVAGPAKNSTIITKQTNVTLDASLSSSATGTPLMYLWQQVLGSPALQILDVSAVTTTAILKGGPGLYTISLKVMDSAGGADQDTLKINYQP
jgi:hypothetical protein